MKRSKRPSTGGLPPLTPDFTRQPILPTLADDNHRLRMQLKAERLRHSRLETMLARYQSVLELQLQQQSAALEELRLALVQTLGQNLITGGGR